MREKGLGLSENIKLSDFHNSPPQNRLMNNNRLVIWDKLSICIGDVLLRSKLIDA